MSQIPDPDDIFRAINEDDEEKVAGDFNRLVPKLRAFKSHHTAACNILANLIKATVGENNTFDRTPANQAAIERAREKLEVRYEKLERCYYRLLSLSCSDKNTNDVEAEYQKLQEKHATLIQARNQLMISMLPKETPHQGQAGGANQNLKPIEALKPSYTLSFENSPTELAAWMAQFKAYYEASRLHVLPVEQQQAFLHQGLDPDVWIAIQQQLDMTTRIFKNALELE